MCCGSKEIRTWSYERAAGFHKNALCQRLLVQTRQGNDDAGHEAALYLRKVT